MRLRFAKYSKPELIIQVTYIEQKRGNELTMCSLSMKHETNDDLYRHIYNCNKH